MGVSGNPAPYQRATQLSRARLLDGFRPAMLGFRFDEEVIPKARKWFLQQLLFCQWNLCIRSAQLASSLPPDGFTSIAPTPCWDVIPMKVVVLLIILLVSGAADASDSSGMPSIYEIPSKHQTHSRYWTVSNTTLVVADAVAKSGDMFFTMQNAARPNFQEHDPLARPFVTHGCVVAGASEGLFFATEVFASYELHKHGHRRMAKVVLLLGAGGNTAGIATSRR